jgi:hypothetical protein
MLDLSSDESGLWIDRLLPPDQEAFSQYQRGFFSFALTRTQVDYGDLFPGNCLTSPVVIFVTAGAISLVVVAIV